MINTAPQGSNSVNDREKYFKAIKYKVTYCAVVAWPSGMRSRFLSWRTLGCRFKSRRGYFQWFLLLLSFLFSFFYYYYYFLSSYYYPLACFCLFSLLLASRDFCDNVFLYILLMLIVSSEHVCWSIRNVKFDVIEVSYTLRLLFLVFVTAVCYPSKYKIQIMIEHFCGALKHATFNPSWWFVFGVTF